MSIKTKVSDNYVWEITLQCRFDFEDWDDAADSFDFVIVAPDYNEALSKAEACAKEIEWTDEEYSGGPKTFNVVETHLLSVSRGKRIDA